MTSCSAQFNTIQFESNVLYSQPSPGNRESKHSLNICTVWCSQFDYESISLKLFCERKTKQDWKNRVANSFCSVNLQTHTQKNRWDKGAQTFASGNQISSKMLYSSMYKYIKSDNETHDFSSWWCLENLKLWAREIYEREKFKCTCIRLNKHICDSAFTLNIP